jgi:hypothetical protein
MTKGRVALPWESSRWTRSFRPATISTEASPYPLSSRESVTLLVSRKTDAENKRLRCFESRKKSIKSQTPSEAEGSAVPRTLPGNVFGPLNQHLLLREKSKGAPGLTFETWDPRNRFQMETPTLPFVIPPAPACRGSVPGFPTSPLSLEITYVVLPKENHMQLTEAATLDRKSGGAEGSAVFQPATEPSAEHCGDHRHGGDPCRLGA